MLLERCGGRADKGVDLRGVWILPKATFFSGAGRGGRGVGGGTATNTAGAGTTITTAAAAAASSGGFTPAAREKQKLKLLAIQKMLLQEGEERRRGSSGKSSHGETKVKAKKTRNKKKRGRAKETEEAGENEEEGQENDGEQISLLKPTAIPIESARDLILSAFQNKLLAVPVIIQCKACRNPPKRSRALHRLRELEDGDDSELLLEENEEGEVEGKGVVKAEELQDEEEEALEDLLRENGKNGKSKKRKNKGKKAAPPPPPPPPLPPPPKPRVGLVTPKNIRELEGTLMNTKSEDMLGILTSTTPCTRGMREAMIASRKPICYVAIGRGDGVVLQMVWNARAVKMIGSRIGVGISYLEKGRSGEGGEEEKEENESEEEDRSEEEDEDEDEDESEEEEDDQPPDREAVLTLDGEVIDELFVPPMEEGALRRLKIVER